ncbi:YbjN domain-containing protein [Mastigocoleus testarum]|uniref:YbjN domain-containing protein n=1 Tax=Mastigocoleus testarum BC008 TaxID=371196 RepID=A0A0V7ZCN0_9CYAN|nr:YbjN domain-containing protein [Mastigocoleus testarum]KST62264.1 hypothetical protein BC008_08835 [Mastigocoleus testarum BC008]
MESLYTSVINFFVQDDWNYTEVEEGRAFKVAVDLDNSNYNCYIIINEEKRNFKFYSISPVKVPENKYTEMAEFFTRANYGMNLGNFEMDFRDGEIRYKTSIYLADNELDFPIIKRMVYANLSTIDDYFPGMIRVIFAKALPEDAICEVEECEKETAS